LQRGGRGQQQIACGVTAIERDQAHHQRQHDAGRGQQLGQRLTLQLLQAQRPQQVVLGPQGRRRQEACACAFGLDQHVQPVVAGLPQRGWRQCPQGTMTHARQGFGEASALRQQAAVEVDRGVLAGGGQVQRAGIARGLGQGQVEAVPHSAAGGTVGLPAVRQRHRARGLVVHRFAEAGRLQKQAGGHGRRAFQQQRQRRQTQRQTQRQQSAQGWAHDAAGEGGAGGNVAEAGAEDGSRPS
jgi:hypothetical protein